MIIFNQLMKSLIVGIFIACVTLPVSSKDLTARISPKYYRAFRGEDVIFKCFVTGNPTPNVTWYSNGNDISSNGRSTTQKIQGGFMIRFKNVHPILHNGTMSCEAINGVDSPVTDTAILNVLIKYARQQSFPAGFPRTVAIYQADVRITVGEDFTFIVNVTGNPPPKITWFKDNRFMDWSNPRITLLANKSLHLARAEESDSGKYDYMAENDKGRIFSRPWFFSAKIKKTPPVFGKGLRDLVVNPQTHVLINCTATGYPKPTVEWKHSEVNHIVRNRGLLTIQNILKTGTYTCVAKNVAGSKSFSVKVTVRPVPLAPVQVVEKAKTGSSLTISWQEGSSNKTIDSHIVKYRGKGTLQWTSVPNIDGQLTVWTIKDLDAYTNYEIQVFSKNSHGTSKGSEIVTVTTDETAPGTVPRDVVVKATSDWSFEISWEPPLQPNGQVTFYRVYYTDKPKQDYNYWRSDTSQQSPLEVRNLLTNHRYAVAISASTAGGSGPLSKHFLVQTLRGAPSDPQNVKTRVLSSTAVEVSWSKPIFNGGGQGIIGYDVYYKFSSDNLDTKIDIQSPGNRKKKVTGLRPYTAYKFAVAAKTDAGSGPTSFQKVAKTFEDVPSVPPTNLSCVSVNPSTIHCTWKPPPVNSRNGKITGYTIRHKTTNQRHSHDEVGGSVQSRTIGGLQAYTTYDIDVAAKTRLGQGPFTDPVKVTTKETRPFKSPQNVTAIVVNSTAIYMKWQTPSIPIGAKLTGSVVYYRRHLEDQDFKTLNTWGNKMDILLTKLEPETDYELRVAFRSAKGSGKVTDALYVKTRQSPPPAPIMTFKKLSAPQLGVHLSWNSSARDIQQFRLRYIKEVERINNATLLRNLPYVEKNFSSLVTSYTYTNFEHGLWYLIKLSVRNPGGWSVERLLWVEMDASKPTGAPMNLKIASPSSTSLKLSWSLPSKWERNGEIIGYKVKYRRAQATGVSEVKDLGKETTLHVRGLYKFTTYKFWVQAKTAAGKGPAAVIEGTTKEDVPSTPPIVEAKGMGRKVVLLKFVAPSIPNGRIIGYKANIYLDDPAIGVGMWKSEVLDENANEMYIGELLDKKSLYWFEVAAKTVAGFGPYSRAVKAETLTYDLPLPVRKLAASVTTSDKVKLTWDVPVSVAAVDYYEINYSGQKTYRRQNNSLETIKDTKVKRVTCCKETFANLDGLVPLMIYVANVSSVGLSQKSETKSINFTTRAARSPPFKRPTVTKSDITKDYIPIYLSRASERNGPISHYLVHVAPLGATLSEARKTLQEISGSSFTNGRSRRATEDANIPNNYIIAKLMADDIPITFKVGMGEDVNGYTNKRLTPKHFYAFTVESCVLDEHLDCLGTMTSYTDVIQFSEVKKPHTTNTQHGGTNPFKLWLLGPVAAVFLLIIVIIVICVLWKRRVRLRNNKPKRLKKMVHDEHLPMMTSPRDPVEMQRLNLETEGMREHPPIHISELELHIEELRADDNKLFTKEYESIDPGMTFISDASARHLNQSKNRYPNIVPYDHTRVVLQETNGFLDSDYINANFMAGYRKPNAYIATQAPLVNTIADFWQMIWEQDTKTIVMMTNLQEKGRIKCDQYWPNQVSEKFGCISVTVLETLEMAHNTIRTFRLCKDGSSDFSKEVKQFQYTAWPDHGVPHYSTSLLGFIRKVRSFNPGDGGPIVVHCSAGVGRTGVFIVIDSMLERIRREQTVDVYGHVTLLRSQRNHMVQTEEQYIFIHETLLEAVLFGHTKVDASNLSQYCKKLNEIGETETTNMEEQFKQLSTFIRPHRFVTAVLPVNKHKNRFPNILPYEHSRVDLVPVRGSDGSNYINASFVDGYKQRRAYIAAQGPLNETVNDFWRMIMEKKSNIIVMLSGTSENGQEMSAEYWPTEKSSKYHFYIVDPVSVEGTPNFILRQFKVNDVMGACPRLVKLFQLRKWPERGKPQNSKGILDLIGQVHTARNNDENKGPVIVHCCSGSGRTGVFCALSIVVERMRAEGVVDLPETVRQLREQRLQMVETLEEYSFCYETALHYLSSFDHIA